MDDKYDTYKTANIEINQQLCFERLVNYLFFGTSSYTCEIYIFERVTQLAHPSALLCQSCRSYMLALELIMTVYNCKTAAIAFIHLSIVSMIS
jgi:hypothetical protein